MSFAFVLLSVPLHIGKYQEKNISQKKIFPLLKIIIVSSQKAPIKGKFGTKC